DERTAFLSEACRDNADLRRRVDVLLAAHDLAGDFLKHPAVQAFDAAPAATQDFGDANVTRTPGGTNESAPADHVLGFLTPSTRSDSLGRLDHYEVLEILGSGGFGIVLRAFDDKLQRVVAVKVLAPQLADRKSVG